MGKKYWEKSNWDGSEAWFRNIDHLSSDSEWDRDTNHMHYAIIKSLCPESWRVYICDALYGGGFILGDIHTNGTDIAETFCLADTKIVEFCDRIQKNLRKP